MARGEIIPDTIINLIVALNQDLGFSNTEIRKMIESHGFRIDRRSISRILIKRNIRSIDSRIKTKKQK